MVELIISLIVTAALIYGYRKVRTEMTDNRQLQAILCVIIAIAIAVAVLYAAFSAIILLTA